MSESGLAKLQCVHAVPANQLCHQCNPEAWNNAQLEIRANPMKKLAEMLQEAGAIPVIDGVSIYEDHVTMPKVRFREFVAESAALHEEIAKLTLLSDSQLANQERLTREVEKLKSRRIHTQEWYASHYAKLQDWARKILPQPWRNQFFSCIANGTYDSMLDVGEAYICKAGFKVVPSENISLRTQPGG
jgi:hypothetical protein